MSNRPDRVQRDVDAGRREFLRSGTLALGALSVAGITATAGESPSQGQSGHTPAAARPYVVVYDRRFPESLAFAAKARSLGLRTRDLDRGDVTRLWYDDLYHRWKSGPAAIAGLTTHDALFVLEGFGNDAGLRLAFRGEHRIGGGIVQHRLTGPASLAGQSALQQCGNDWSEAMALIVHRCPATHRDRSEASVATRLVAAGPAVSRTLYSWVLVPARRQASMAKEHTA